MSGNYDEIIAEILKELNRQREAIRQATAQRHLYEILNVNRPAQLTANQNNYDPGDFDVLTLTSDASRNITGISGGVEGRALYLNNNGTQNIVLVHQSALSSAENRLALPGAVNHTMTGNTTGTRTRALLIYHDSRWRLYFESAP